MLSMSQMMQEYIKRQQENTTEKQQKIVEELLEVATAWHEGKMPLEEAMRLTGDGWLRTKVGQRLLGSDASIWSDFIEAILEEAQADCSLGVQTAWGFISAQEIHSAGGRIERVYDVATQQTICNARFPEVNLERPAASRSSFFGSEPQRTASMVEWME